VSGYQQGPDDGRAWQDRYPQQDRDPQGWAPQPPQPGPMVPAPQQFQPYPPQPVVVIPAKTPGLAVLFSFLWLGAGNCYAGQVGLGVAFIIAQVVCAPIAALLASVTFGISLFFTVPIWIAAFAVSAATGYSSCKEHNRRLGLPRY
jgi:TM2 domain-containing membrane protein YozV